MTVVLVGLGIGILGTLGLARLLASTLSGLLLGVRAADPVTLHLRRAAARHRVARCLLCPGAPGGQS